MANLANDLSDFRRGADTPDRQGPVRVAAAGLVTERQLEVAIAIMIGLAGLVGLWLVAVGGWVLLALGALAIVAALAYTGGPFPYGYRALGEVFVFVFFGLVAVVGTAYLQALRLDPLFLVVGDPAGCADHRDPRRQQPARHPDRHGGRQADARRGARPAPDAGGVRGAPGGGVRRAGDAVPGLARGLDAVGRAGPVAPFVLLPLLTLPMATPLLRTVRGFGEPRELNLVLKGTARLSLAFSLLFALGLALSGLVPGGGS